jgi:hypothetical protein
MFEQKINNINKKHPEGMILAFTLMLLALISLMGIAILTSSTTELSISGHNRIGREAFNSADTSARIATLLSRILLHPELGNPDEVITTSDEPSMPITIELNDDRFTLAKIQQEAHENGFSYTDRYQEALGTNTTGLEPHLVFKVKDRQIATATISFEADNPIGAGSSLSVADSYDEGGGAAVQVNLIITVNGRPMRTISLNEIDEPHSLLTAIYREYM